MILGNVSCAPLMGLEDFYILMIQQLISLIFVTDAFINYRKRPVTESVPVKARLLSSHSINGVILKDAALKWTNTKKTVKTKKHW